MRCLTALIIAPLLFASCGVDKRCDHVCAALRSVKRDSEGYLPRDQIFQAAGIQESNVLPYAIVSGGGCVLDCGCWLMFTERNSLSFSDVKTIDQILNNPNRTACLPQSQLVSVSLVSKHSKELCRVESSAAQRRQNAVEYK
jgi:hypothetical protein